MHARDADTTQRTLLSPGPNEPVAGNACLVVIHGEGLGRRADINLERPVVIGRDHGCDLLILHPSVSRRHCEIWLEGGRYRVRDLGSTNTTRLNDRPVESADLADGDLLVVGESIVKFVGDSSVEASYHEEVYQLASHDELTGLYNRRLFIELFERELVRTERDGLELAFAILDIDWFKRINDTYGHQAGDQVLRQVAQVLRRGMRTQDLGGRIGGEEFGMLIPGLDIASAHARLEAIRTDMESTQFVLDGTQLPVTISAGMALRTPGRADRPSLMRAADLALYQAKQDGRNRIVRAD
ncbi:MAG TPA: GGDEF domain-containing protein [Chiayiivirga sp.]|nr:GGDEF domain-containing protein [Chiayiivirga sp.]